MVRGFVKSFKETQKENPNTDLKVVPKKKLGRPTLLPEEIDQKVMIMIKKMRESGAVINYSIITAVATGIVIANDRTLLKENGGRITLGIKWCESILKRLGYVKRKATTAKPLIAPDLIKEIGLTFYNDINEIVHAHAIPAEMIINIDQTPLPFALISKYTLEKKGSSRVSVPATSDYRQITGTFAISMTGSFEMIEMITKILIPYIKRKREELNVPNKPWLLTCNVFKVQWTEAVKNVAKESNRKMVSVPNNWTNYFQPLDLTVNRSSKDVLRKEAQSLYSQEIVKQMEARKRSDQIKVDVRVCGETAGCKMDRQVL